MKEYYAVKAGEDQKQVKKVSCPNCPGHVEKIKIITKERDEARLTLAARDTELAELNARYARLEEKRIEMERMIIELQKKLDLSKESVEVTIREKETIIIELNSKMEGLFGILAAKDAEIADLQGKLANLLGICGDLDAQVKNLQGVQQQVDELLQVRLELEQRITGLLAELKLHEDKSKIIEILEEQVAFCKANHGKKELVKPTETITWYYAVQNPLHAQLFQKEQKYAGGEIVVDALEGATVVNPEYYVQSDQVPGNPRLRVRVVTAQVPGSRETSLSLPPTEIFIRLRLGSATQFTPPHPHTQSVTWNQDFVFVGVPIVEHHNDPGSFIAAESLIIEVVSRTAGSEAETLIGTSTLDLSDLIHTMTRQVMVSLNKGGVVNLRLKALDFGLPPRVAASLTSQDLSMVSEPAHECEVALDVRREHIYNMLDIEAEEQQDFVRVLNEHHEAIRNSPPHVLRSTYTYSSTRQSN